MICGIIFGSIGVYASNLYKANDILYTTKDGIISNVNDELDNLYQKINNSFNTSEGVTIIRLGTATSYNIKEMFPGIDYTKLTNDNFVVGSEDGNYTFAGTGSSGLRCYASSGGYDNTQSASFTCTGTISVTKSYDPSTGILTVTGTNVSGTFVYLLKGTIIN